MGEIDGTRIRLGSLSADGSGSLFFLRYRQCQRTAIIATSIAPPTAAAIIIFAAVDKPPEVSSLGPDMFSVSRGSSNEDIRGSAAPVPLLLVMTVLVTVVLPEESVADVEVWVVVEDILPFDVEVVVFSVVEAELSVVVGLELSVVGKYVVEGDVLCEDEEPEVVVGKIVVREQAISLLGSNVLTQTCVIGGGPGSLIGSNPRLLPCFSPGHGSMMAAGQKEPVLP